MYRLVHADLVLKRFSSQSTRNPLFDKILIANRGEIAVRVIKTARKLGIQTVAVYSEADKNAMHVEMADEAYLIGPAPSAQSYLNSSKIIQVAKSSGAQAIHPGYGFLSENADFADLVSKSGIEFIGPPVKAIVDMGSKSASKKIMSAAKVPVIPGYHGEDQSLEKLHQEAEKIGYPVIIKAVKGGGGKGMRIVENPDDFEMMLDSAKREAIKSFSDDKVLVEKYLVKPRHVEVQVFADKMGNAVYLFERDCSVQRRHQKILEEAPAPGLSEELRKSLGEKAVAAAKAVGYVGAGTVEFILDTLTNKFYFMEMNTRLQVEHPVTEMITGQDLVQWQLEVASGNRLPLLQNQLQKSGHSFEARIYAENPANNFLPDTGPLIHLRPPTVTEGGNVRVETGVRQNDQVSVFYDPMICKLVVKASDRKEALRLMHKNLSEFQVVGLKTNIEFLKSIIEHRSFIEADLDTGFIKTNEADLFREKQLPQPNVILHASLGILSQELAEQDSLVDPWNILTSLRLNGTFSKKYEFSVKNGEKSVELSCLLEFNSQTGLYEALIDDSKTRTELKNIQLLSTDKTNLKANVDGHLETSTFVRENLETVHVYYRGKRETLFTPIPEYLKDTSSNQDLKGQVVTPMPCKISQIMVEKGEKVEKGDPLIVLEAMKMEHLIRAPHDGVIKEIKFKVGDIVGQNKLLITFE